MQTNSERKIYIAVAERISKLLFSAGIALAAGVWIYIFPPMRMTDAILPGSPLPGNIKRLCIAPLTSFRFLLASSKDRPADTRENIPSLSLSLYLGPISTAEGLFISREHIQHLFLCFL